MLDVTQILRSVEQGGPQAARDLLPLVYDELRKLARGRMAQESPDHTLQATALVHEAWLRLVGAGQQPPAWDGRRHFFAAAAEAMRRILVESGRARHRLKRGGRARREPLHDVAIECDVPQDELLALDEALDRLAQEDPQKAELVRLRYFAGLTQDQAAEVLGVSPETAKRWWRYARAWLRREMHD